MWTPATRGRTAEIEKKTKRYPTDLTDEEWARIEPFLPGAAKSGRPARTDLRAAAAQDARPNQKPYIGDKTNFHFLAYE